MIDPEGAGFDPVPIKVQGITIRPGESVLLRLLGGDTILRKYHCLDLETGDAYLKRETYSTHPRHDTGPWPLDMLQHPDLLTGIVKEIDAAD